MPSIKGFLYDHPAQTGNEEIAYEGLTSVYEGDQRTQTPGTQITKAIHLYFYWVQAEEVWVHGRLIHDLT